MPVAVTVNHQTKPGLRDTVRATWESWMPAVVSANPGHLAYWYCFDRTDPQVIRAFQVYRDEAAAKAFLEEEAYAGYVAAVEHMLEGPPEVTMADVIWSKEMSHAGR